LSDAGFSSFSDVLLHAVAVFVEYLRFFIQINIRKNKAFERRLTIKKKNPPRNRPRRAI
jgi:hypothetical protein